MVCARRRKETLATEGTQEQGLFLRSDSPLKQGDGLPGACSNHPARPGTPPNLGGEEITQFAEFVLKIG